MTTPSPYRERVVQPSTRRSAVSCVTVTTLWLAARGVVGGNRRNIVGKASDTVSASGSRACFPRHRPIPSRVPPGRSNYALFGARLGWM